MSNEKREEELKRRVEDWMRLELGAYSEAELISLAHFVATVEREAREARDFEWWQEIVLVDNVAPEPKAAKAWLLHLAKFEQDEAAREAREAALEDAARLVEEHVEHIDISEDQNHVPEPGDPPRCCVAAAIRALGGSHD